MKNNRVPSTDFRKDQKELITIIFPKSKSKNYEYAVSTAEVADYYELIQYEGESAHLASYKCNKKGAQKAMALLEVVQDWRGTRIFSDFAKEELITEKYYLRDTLQCYIQAMQSNMWTEHCYRTTFINTSMRSPRTLGSLSLREVIDFTNSISSNDEERQTWLIPCKKVVGYVQQIRDPDPNAKMEDRVQAVAVEKGCHFCPLIDETKTKRLR